MPSKTEIAKTSREEERGAISEFILRKSRWYGHKAKPPKGKASQDEGVALLAARGFHLIQASILLDLGRAIAEGAHLKEEKK